MKTTSIRARAALCALLAGTAYCGLTAPANAQQIAVDAFPVRQYVDGNGVDQFSGTFMAASPGVLIGGRDNGLFFQRIVRGAVFRESMMATIDVAISVYTVAFGDRSERFTNVGGSYVPEVQNGSTLASGSGNLIYTASDGTRITFIAGGLALFKFGNARPWVATNITFPSGRQISFYYVTGTYNGGSSNRSGRRLQSVTSSTGYHLKLTYELANVTSALDEAAWSHVVQVTGLNSSTDSCSTSANSCTFSGTRPQLTINGVANTTRTYTDSLGQTSEYTFNGGEVATIRRPGSSSPDVSVSYSGGRVASVTRDGVTTAYSYADANGVRTTTATRGSASRIARFDIANARITQAEDELGRLTSYLYNSANRLERVTLPEGNYVQYTYDGRGNVIETRAVAKPNSGQSDIVVAAGYDTNCTNTLICNSPNNITDARGNTTDFTYDSTHGGMLSVTGPAPTTGAARPQTRYSYTSTNSEYRLTGISACSAGTSPSCVGTADEARTVLDYDSNANVTSVEQRNGSGTINAASVMTYDILGNLTTVDGPLTGAADTTGYRYDAARQLVGVIGPDPDGGGTLHHRAQRITYPSDGLPTKVEVGSVDSQSDADWINFTNFEEAQQEYDANDRPSIQRLVSGGTTFALSQTSYDGLGRLECVARRMNPSEFASLPADACTLDTAGSYGPDRIVKTIYDAGGRVNQVKSAFGVAGEEANEVTITYTANGQVETATDAENNKTTFEYDGHDRLAKTRYPDTTKGAGTSSTTDYEQSSYESVAGGTRTTPVVTAFRNRAGESIGFGYDALGRLTSKDLPGTEPDATYSYDLMGWMLSATQNGVTASFTYDALGRQLTQTIPIASVTTPTFTSEYDLAGRRTKLTWPVDASSSTAYYANYDYLVTGEVEKVREKGATSGAGVLTVYGYDDLGRRTSMTRGNGATTSYSYDAVSRLSGMSHDFSGTTNDLTLGFSYNPASQIVSTTRSNDLYAWNGHGSGSTSSTADGKNRLSSHAGAIPTYDARGNLTNDGSFTYAYSSENLLTSTGSSGPLEYDPLMRFYKNYTTYFIHDGVTGELVGDYHNGSIVSRHVPGAAADEPVGYIDKFGARTYYHADERASVIAGSSDSGANARIVLYDEYGKRGAGGSYRFAYTGQVHLLNDVYDYKSRNYYARLGRFGQTDAIRYAGGMNLYGYVGADPVNYVDPLGLDKEEGEEEEDEIVVCGGKRDENGKCVNPSQGIGMSGGVALPGAFSNESGHAPGFDGETIVVTGKRLAQPRGVNPEVSARQQRACLSIPAVRDPTVRRIIAAVHQAGRNFVDGFGHRRRVEFAAWLEPSGSGFVAGPLFTDGQRGQVNAYRRMSWRTWWHGGAIIPHNHTGYGLSQLSTEDVQFADRYNILVIAVGDDGRLYCHDSR